MSIAKSIVLISFIQAALTQVIQTGLVTLTPFSISNQYSLQNYSPHNNFVISISTFQSIQPLTSCYARPQQTRVLIICTQNVVMFSYLSFPKNPMIVSSTFTYFFFDKDLRASVIWYAPINQTQILKPQIRAFLTGYEQIDSLNSQLTLSPTPSNLSICISRSANIRQVNFSYIILQPSPLFNLTFVDIILSQVQKYYVNNQILAFFGIEQIVFGKTLLNQTASLMYKSNGSVRNQLSFANMIMTSNLQITLLLIYDIQTLDGQKDYYSPLDSSINSCLGYPYLWQYQTYTIKYCFSSPYSSQSQLNNSNWADIYKYMPFGCSIPHLQIYSQVLCGQCLPGYILFLNQCKCDYGYMNVNNSCIPCNSTENGCSLLVLDSVNLLNGDYYNSSSLQIILQLPQLNSYQRDSPPNFTIVVIINQANYSTVANYNSNSQQISISIFNFPYSNSYNISIPIIPKSQNVFLVVSNNSQFLWVPFMPTVTIGQPFAMKSFVKSLSPVFQNSDKSVPVLVTISFLIGQKINVLSIFQTISILYLVRFLTLKSEYWQIQAIVQEIFIFQPKPLFSIFGNASLVNWPSFNTTKVQLDANVQQYTAGSMYMETGLNNMVNLGVQMIIIYLIIKIIKCLTSPARNQVGTYESLKYAIKDFKRSNTNKKGQVKWKNQLRIRQSATLKQKLYFFVCSADQKKMINFTSMVIMQILSNAFLIMSEMTVPIYDSMTLISKMVSFISFLAIIIYPSVLINTQPLHLLKSTFIIYKRKDYTQRQLFIYFYLNYMENIALPFVIIAFQGGIMQILGVITILTIKILVFRKKIKHIEMIKAKFLLLFYLVILLAQFLPVTLKESIIQLLIISILCVLSCQFIKLFRSLLIMILALFKETKQNKGSEVEKQSNSKPAEQMLKVEVLKQQTLNYQSFRPQIRKNIRRDRQNMQKSSNKENQNQIKTDTKNEDAKPVNFEERALQRQRRRKLQ